MFYRRLLDRWLGVLLSIIGVVATLWLGFTGQLALYIHPRYFVFTIVMAVIAGVTGAGRVRPGSRRPRDGAHAATVRAHGHADGHADAGNRHWRRLGTAGSTLIAAAAVVGLLVLPPSTLSSATVTQRDLNGSASTLSRDEAVGTRGRRLRNVHDEGLDTRCCDRELARNSWPARRQPSPGS